MKKTDIELLESNGWEVECESPFEIRTKDGSFASGQAAIIVLSQLREDIATKEVETFEALYDLLNQIVCSLRYIPDVPEFHKEKMVKAFDDYKRSGV